MYALNTGTHPPLEVNEDLKITIQIEGLDSEEGHVRLDGLIHELTLIRKSMGRVDKLVDGRSSAYFRIVNASQSNRLTIVLEPTKIKTQSYTPTDRRITEFHHKYFSELSSLANGREPSDDIDDETLAVLNQVAEGKGKNYKSLLIQNAASSVGIDDKFQTTVRALLANQIVAHGSLNVHGDRSNMIWLYPSSGPRRVACKIPARYKEIVSASARKIVTVYGKKHYRASSVHPHFIEVEIFDLVPADDPEDHISKLQGAFKGKGDNESTDNIVSSIRNEWE